MKSLNLFLAVPFLAAMAAVAAGQAPVREPEPEEEEGGGRIVGGEEAPAGSAPWQAELYSIPPYTKAEIDKDSGLREGHPDKIYLDRKGEWERVHRCGGAYIGDDWVITAAHCVAKITTNIPDVRRIRLGTQNLTIGGATWRIDRVVIHKDYHPDRKKHDIALIRIAADPQTTRLDPGRLQPIRLLGTRPTDRPLASFDRVLVTGWGLTSPRASGARTKGLDGRLLQGSAVLMQVALSVFPEARCAAVPEYRNFLGKGVICAGSAQPGKDACTGDSGGPLTRAQGRERVLVGLVSWGKGCALPDTPGIYTSVTDYLGWVATAKQGSRPGQTIRI